MRLTHTLPFFEKLYFISGLIYCTEPFLPFANYTTLTVDPLSGADKLPVIENGTPLLVLRVFILGITLILTGIRFNRIVYLALRRRVFTILALLFPLSFLWSPVPEDSLRGAIILIGFTLFGFNLAIRYSLREQLVMLAWAMGVLVVINLLFTLAVPSAGIESGQHAGAWRGLYFQKNLFARMMVLSSITMLLAALESVRFRMIFWVGLGLSVLLVLLSTSRGALLILLVLLIMIPLFRMLRWHQGIVLPSAMIMLLSGSSIAIFLVGNAESILRFMGRDITLTGRTTIWAVSLSKLMNHLWLGYGYQGFWREMEGDSADVWYETLGFHAPHAHNGLLDIALELGLVGLVLFLLSYVKNSLRAVSWLRLKTTAVGLFPLLFLTLMLLYNITESTIYSPPLTWVLYASITSSILLEPILVKNDPPDYTPDYTYDPAR
jgi:exopolysaccharide production protein ExoQ